MDLMDLLCSQYRLSLHEAFFKFPLRLALALAPWAKRRLGYKVEGPDAALEAGLKARQRMSRLLKQRYEIAPRKPAKKEAAA